MPTGKRALQDARLPTPQAYPVRFRSLILMQAPPGPPDLREER